MNVLFFTEISPFPINGGEKIRSYGILKALSNLNYKVTAIIRNDFNVVLSEYQLKNVEFITYETSKQSFIERLLFLNFFKKDNEVVSLLKKILGKNTFDVVILDYYISGRYTSVFTKLGTPVVIGTHNAESHLISQKPTLNIFSFLRKIQLYGIMYLHERYFYKKAKAIITVSQEDSNFHSKFYPKDNIFMIPNFLDESRYDKDFERENHFVMSANFNAYMNLEGLKWLVTSVWNEDIDKNHKLYLVGRNSIEVCKELKIGDKFKNIKAIGEVDDMIPYIGKAKAVFIPLLQGSGSRLKCLEAMALKTPILATSKGVEGINSNSIIIANDSNGFRHIINNTKYNDNIGENLFQDFIKEYSLKVNTERIKDLLERVTQKGNVND